MLEEYKKMVERNLDDYLKTKDKKYFRNIKTIIDVQNNIDKCTNNTFSDFYDLFLAQTLEKWNYA